LQKENKSVTFFRSLFPVTFFADQFSHAFVILVDFNLHWCAGLSEGSWPSDTQVKAGNLVVPAGYILVLWFFFGTAAKHV